LYHTGPAHSYTLTYAHASPSLIDPPPPELNGESALAHSFFRRNGLQIIGGRSHDVEDAYKTA
jgi:hypothetical protein